jgi:hypothetical protein
MLLSNCYTALPFLVHCSKPLLKLLQYCWIMLKLILYRCILLHINHLFLVSYYPSYMQLAFYKLNFKILTSPLRHWCMPTTCFDKHCSSSGFSKIADETAVVHTTTHLYRTQGRTDEGTPQKLNLRTEAQQFRDIWRWPMLVETCSVHTQVT